MFGTSWVFEYIALKCYHCNRLAQVNCWIFKRIISSAKPFTKGRVSVFLFYIIVSIKNFHACGFRTSKLMFVTFCLLPLLCHKSTHVEYIHVTEHQNVTSVNSSEGLHTIWEIKKTKNCSTAT